MRANTKRLRVEQLERRDLLASYFNHDLWKKHTHMTAAQPTIVVSQPISPGTYALVPVVAPVTQRQPKGYTTFYQSAATDHALPSKEMYERFDWNTIEPTLGGPYNFKPIDDALAAAKASNQGFSFRVMTHERGQPGPLAYAGLPGTSYKFSEDGISKRQPDLNNGTVQTWLAKLIASLGVRYGADPMLSSVDMGWFGAFGEWSADYGTSGVVVPRPTTATTEWLIDRLKAAFPRSYIIVQASLATDDLAAFKYAMAQGCGWRGDSVGNWSVNGGWADQENIYAPCIAAAPDQWKKAPVIFEICDSSLQSWIDKGRPWQKTFTWIETTAHGWAINVKSSGVPAVMQPAFQHLLSTMQ